MSANIQAAGGGSSIYIDARGADAGVEHRLMSMMATVEQRAINKSLSIMADNFRRGR